MRRLTSLAAAAWCLGCAPKPSPRFTPADSSAIRQVAATVTDSVLAHPDPADWPQYGRTRDEQRHSPLDQVDTTNVRRLGVAWRYDLGGYGRMEATPIVVGGVMYVTGPWNVVHAVDAASGRRLWAYDPQIPRRTPMCCGAVNRGVAVYRGRVYVGTLDGRLIALDAGTGALQWSLQTTDTAASYSITGAPRAGHGLVYIGNGGAEFAVRGYVSAYDATTGALRWRTHTVPGNPALGFESESMRTAARTWRGEWWRYGGGGTVWDAIVVDAVAPRVYIGTGNGSPWLRSARSPGGGDNLYLASILALDANSGQILWHYQTAPGDSWDYTATQPIVLAAVNVGGERRQVLMQAPKNGFFYVLDQETGAVVKASPIVPMTWATGIDSVTGRPIESAAATLATEPVEIRPSPSGAHNWHAMAWSPTSKLMYLTVTDAGAVMSVDSTWRFDPRHVNRGVLIGPSADPDATIATSDGTLDMVAWDPVRGKEAWRVRHPDRSSGGVLSVEGGLVFVGRNPSRLVAYRARDGERLWEMDAGGNVEAPPISFAVGGLQYIAVAVGNNVPSSQLFGGEVRADYRGRAAIVVYTLDGRGNKLLPRRDPPPHQAPLLPESETVAGAATLRDGLRLYDKYCVRCHGPAAASGGPAPDLRYSSALVRTRYKEIVLEGALSESGMPSFASQISPSDLAILEAYIRDRARLVKKRS